MIISRTPVRISFSGGGTDIERFYKKYGGMVISTTVDKYIYITVNKKFDDLIRVAYSRVEYADNYKKIDNPLIRYALQYFNIDNGVEITSISDVPSEGTGLGSSSSYVVGLLKALSTYMNIHLSAHEIAEAACEIEIGRCKEPIGKQDQYAAAYGGLNRIAFAKDGQVTVTPYKIPAGLEENLMLFYTGITRSSKDILKSKLDEESLIKILAITEEMDIALEHGDLYYFGRLLGEEWDIKRGMGKNITNPKIDEWVFNARHAGAQGGKLLGAGGGGFLLFFVPLHQQSLVRDALFDLRQIPFKFDNYGSTIIHVS